VFTDSFHGSVFSIIFHRQFLVFERDKNNNTSKNSRLYDLLNKFNLYHRLIKDNTKIEETMGKEIDFVSVEKILEEERKKSADYLKMILEKENIVEKKMTTIKDQNKDKCVGCGLCSLVCPKKCISMHEDEEGYIYPVIDEKQCVECGLCLKECVTSIKKKLEVKKKTYVGYNNNENIRKDSSSGGLFYPIAYNFITNGGVVYGAAFNSEFLVNHIRIDNVDDIPLLMQSKYVQSSLMGIWNEIHKDLISGKKVLFAGTPCQTAAIKKYFEKNNTIENLYTIDFICHGVPSPEIWKSYLDNISKNRSVREVNFRDKSRRGWHDFCLNIKFDNTSKIIESHYMNAYMRLFLSDKNLRPSCYSCGFKANNYWSDITLADAWKIEKERQDWADDKGTSLVISRTTKGNELLNDSLEIVIRESDYDFWSKMNPSLIKSSSVGIGRKDMFEDFKKLTNDDFWKKYSKVPYKVRAKYICRRLVKMAGIEGLIRKRL
jgi:coenzyme F420-reducing hydrogenase beta subunit